MPQHFSALRILTFRLLALLGLALLVASCQPAAPGSGPASAAGTPGTLTVYSGRTEALVGPLLDRFRRETSIDIRVRYGDSAELAAAILEEGANSPADVFFAQDAGALGAIANRNLLAALPDSTLNKVDPRFRSANRNWVGVSGRARVVVYNPQSVQDQQLPDSVLGLTDPVWRGRVGWAPTNSSFQAFVTALRRTEGEDVARRWLEGMRQNQTKSFANNTAIVQAVASGEIDLGLVNHYYLFAIQKDQGAISARNYHPRDGRAGAMINVAGAGILATSNNQEAARRFLDYLLSPESQTYFTTQTFEYPLLQGLPQPQGAAPIDQIKTPNIDLGSLADLDATLRMLRDVGAL
ncbi:MAG: iron ABC transporter substrate-binding protein [Chloroflexi bacterium]|nr:iron ABC transporter substrate-binding protein [Chloroflexota bacterium]